jgi:nucleotide-binding universal stress UspA family protein
MKRLLVPCDFSSQSGEALQFAIHLAAKVSGDVVVLHVINLPILFDPTFGGGLPMVHDPAIYAGLEHEAKQEFKKLLKDIDDQSVNIDFMVMEGEVISTIENTIEQNKIDLVVMGTAGATGLRETFIGSNTEKVVRHSSVPVLTIRTAPALNSIKKILLPTELALNQTEFINQVQELQQLFNATVHILLINTPTHFRTDLEAQEALEEFAKYYKLNDYITHFRNDHTEEDGILAFAHEAKIDLIVMGTHARKGVAHLFNGSITEDVVNHSHCPIWTSSIKK